MEIAELVDLATRVKRDLAKLRTRVDGSVMFVDLVGSTEFKATHPNEDEWLVRLARFLRAVTQIVEAKGRVVKYIGDEVMAFFEGNAAVLNAEHAAEDVLEFCDQFTQETFRVKIAMDFGSVSMLDFVGDKKERFGRADPNGLIVDRCARIMAKNKPGVVLCSVDFKNASKHKARWAAAGKFRAKGLPRPVKVFQLRDAGTPLIEISDADMGLDDCLKRLAATEGYLAELRSVQKPLVRRPRS